MYVRRRAGHELSIVDGVVINHSDGGSPFDREAYARFKYGYLPPATEYARWLAWEMEDDLFQLAGAEPIRIISAPYKYLPTASHAIAKALARELSATAIGHGYEPPVLVPFFKDKMGDDSYANGSEADRLRQLAALGLRIDESQIRDAHVLVVDDIRITGTAEKTTADYLETLNPRGVWYLHAAVLPEDQGKSNPAIESALNQSVPHGWMDVLDDVNSGQFSLNTRVLRHILEYSDDGFTLFVQHAPDNLLREIHDASMGNGLAYYNKYRTHLKQIATALLNRERNSRYVAV
ncbi:MAG: phosphoribosyltransferase family protein [Candidatus Microsaccharimonas sp.]